MLVLTRHAGETIVINEEITITVVRIHGDKVRLGIEAPPHISVHRSEVLDAIVRERKLNQANEVKPSLN